MPKSFQSVPEAAALESSPVPKLKGTIFAQKSELSPRNLAEDDLVSDFSKFSLHAHEPDKTKSKQTKQTAKDGLN